MLRDGDAEVGSGAAFIENTRCGQKKQTQCEQLFYKWLTIALCFFIV